MYKIVTAFWYSMIQFYLQIWHDYFQIRFIQLWYSLIHINLSKSKKLKFLAWRIPAAFTSFWHEIFQIHFVHLWYSLIHKILHSVKILVYISKRLYYNNYIIDGQVDPPIISWHTNKISKKKLTDMNFSIYISWRMVYK